jgi:Periplasmic copper-binding protein (NosD)
MLLAVVSSPSTAADCGGRRSCSCGDRVMADYRLTADLGPCPASGLRVGARVILEGQGHAIVGSGAEKSVGLQIQSSAEGTFVQNLTVHGFERGIRLAGASRVELTAVRVHANGDRRGRVGYGIDFAGGASSNRVERAVVFGNADEGIHFGSHTRGNRVVRSEVYDNGRENVYVLDGVENVLEECVIHGGGKAAVYIKHAKATLLVRNRISDRPVMVRGAASGTRLVDNEISGAGVVLQPYLDKELGPTRPARTLLRGGAVSGADVCIRVDEAEGTLVEQVRLACKLGLEVAGGSVVDLVDVELPGVRCSGSGELRDLRRVEVRFIDEVGAPIPNVRLRSGAAPAIDLGSAGANGVFIGELVESVRTCPDLRARRSAPIRLEWKGGATTSAVDALVGQVVVRGEPAVIPP